ncbi:MAG: LOG family protein [Acidimicrobiales bacterium]
MPGRARYRTGHDELDERIAELVEATGVTDNADLVFEMITSAVRMGREDADRGDLKLVNAALKELRYSFLVFQPYVGVPKVSIFGSARTTRTDPAYRLAHDFAQRIVEHQWMVITGAGPGIMEAGIAGAGTDHSFGVNIVLPFEQEATPLIAGDPKLINYRYFFTRKLTFMKESRAFVLLPGGFGTMDEGFELFTLMQTGRTPLVPVVLLDEPGSTYWTAWLDFVRNELGGRGLISDHDISLVRLTQDIDDAVDEICSFYSTYHSMRFVGRRLVLRLQRELTDGELAGLDRDFGDIVTSGGYQRVAASPSEVEDQDVPDLPRIAFRFDRSSYNRLRHLINRLNGRD